MVNEGVIQIKCKNARSLVSSLGLRYMYLIQFGVIVPGVIVWVVVIRE